MIIRAMVAVFRDIHSGEKSGIFQGSGVGFWGFGVLGFWGVGVLEWSLRARRSATLSRAVAGGVGVLV